jgi:hypothetical protein
MRFCLLENANWFIRKSSPKLEKSLNEFGGVIYEGVCCEFHFLVQKLGLNFFGFRFD